MGNKSDKLPNIYICSQNGEIAQHNLNHKKRKEGSKEVRVRLPLSPSEIGKLVRKIVPTCYPSSIDKVCLLIGDAYTISCKQKKNGTGCFEVGVDWAEDIVSRIGGKRPLKLLFEMGLIEKDVPHRATIRPKAITYRFKIPIQRFKTYKITLTGKAAEKSLESGIRGQKRQKTDPGFSWVGESLERVGLSFGDLKDYRKRPGHHKKSSSQFENGERRNNWNGAYRTNIVCQMPEDLRERLLFNGQDPVMLLDISSSFGNMLPWLFADDSEQGYNKNKINLKEKMSRDEECQQLRLFLSDKDFYQKLLPWKTREIAKDAFQRFLNSSPDPLAKQIGKQFGKRFPCCERMIRRRRGLEKKGSKESDSNLFHELYGRQSEIINAVILKCREASIPCIPVNDELIVPFTEGHTVREWMQEEIYKQTGVKAKVGGLRYEHNMEPIPSQNHLPPPRWFPKIRFLAAEASIVW